MLSLSGQVRAQDKSTAAETLFKQARQLTADGKHSEACPKYAESQRLDPAIGTQFYLAECLENIGKLASAWSNYLQVADLAKTTGQKEKEKFARSRVKALEPKLAKLTIQVPVAQRDIAGLEIELDGKTVDANQWDTAVPVDTGKHVISANAPGKKPWEESVEITKNGTTISVFVPVLEDVESLSDDQPSSAQRTAGFIVGAAGIVGLGLGTAFGIIAMTKKSDADSYCDDNNFCDDTGVELRSSAITAATVSTIGFIAGGVILATGGVLVLTAPSPTESDEQVGFAMPRIEIGPTGIFVTGSW